LGHGIEIRCLSVDKLQSTNSSPKHVRKRGDNFVAAISTIEAAMVSGFGKGTATTRKWLLRTTPNSSFKAALADWPLVRKIMAECVAKAQSAPGGLREEQLLTLDRGIREQVIERLETSPLLPLEQEVGFFLIWEL
jgi:hypothetical protein